MTSSPHAPFPLAHRLGEGPGVRAVSRIRLLTAVLCLLASAFLAPAQTWITNSLTISETNTNYDGLDLVISGTGVTVAMDGPHAFNSLLLTNGALLTHSPCTDTATHKLDLTVSNAVVVSTNSRIDVSGLGYVAGRTSGNTTSGAATGSSGGSYGGLGGSYQGSANAAYGDYANPGDWGSGTGGLAGGSGGGLVRLMAGSLLLDGQLLLANGATIPFGGGAGGGIYVAVNTLAGAGRIQAGGAGGWGGLAGGGGGRVAVHAGDYSGFGLANITALGAGGTYAETAGGAGTVWLVRGQPHTHVQYHNRPDITSTTSTGYTH